MTNLLGKQTLAQDPSAHAFDLSKEKGFKSLVRKTTLWIRYPLGVFGKRWVCILEAWFFLLWKAWEWMGGSNVAHSGFRV